MNKFDVKVLENILEERGIKIKILHFEPSDVDKMWLVYTFDLSYVPEIHIKDRKYLTGDEDDIIILSYDEEWDYQEAAADILWKAKGGAE